MIKNYNDFKFLLFHFFNLKFFICLLKIFRKIQKSAPADSSSDKLAVGLKQDETSQNGTPDETPAQDTNNGTVSTDTPVSKTTTAKIESTTTTTTTEKVSIKSTTQASEQ